ncbi:RcnB family protein [Pseudomonas sp. LP_7_YM]|uniref:RcnB family protein n=1 Tax=Pseudomonas sp. LP_7_YM TaxID=2485137 RepID=UPI00105D62B3|nr:RcnB family protein [Pseudomonas sp. LP_7_YM]TDV72522.1 nickel/cobalt transporter regulator [Pseudomonas sp. LP_7_YM]
MIKRTSALQSGPACARPWPGLRTAGKCLPGLTLVASCVLSGSLYAAQDTSVTLDRLGAGITQIKEGDNVPDEYQRPSLAVQDWQARHLSAPGKNEQWVEIKGKFALVSIPTGTIKQLVDRP